MGHLLHLLDRFLGALRPRPLRPADQAETAALLRPAERLLFWRQAAADQRHALACARAVLGAAPGRIDLARAALLHDVGKGGVRLGTVGRSLATVLSLLGLPVRGRMSAYLAHPERGADELRRAGAEELVVDFARHHHTRRPPGIPPGDWELLRASDRA